MKTLYTSDLHIGHVNIMKYCPARQDYLGIGPDATVTDMNEALVRLWNSQVDHDDVVYVLGDVCMGKVDETINYVRRLNGTKYLILGNHDRPHDIMTGRKPERQAEWFKIYTDVGFKWITTGPVSANFGGIFTIMSHFPYDGDHTEEERYGQYRPADEGHPLVHGHVHDHWQTRGRQYNVGIDAWNGVFQTGDDIENYFRSLGY